MKKLYGILIAFLFIAIMLGGATEVKSQTSKSQISIEVIKEYQVPIIISSGGANSVSMGELQMFYREFMPILPYEPVNILLPFGEELDEVAISYSNEIIIDGTHDIEIYPMPIPTGTTGPIFEIVEEEVPATYPPEVLEVLDIVSYRGYSILPVNLFPVKYYTNEGKLSYFETIEVSITTRPSTDKTINKMFRGLPEDRQYLMGMVDTTTSISSYDGMQETLDLDPGDYDYVIITDDSFVPEFQPLIDWKNSVGIKTAIETVQNIQTNYSGADTQEKIRNFITDAYLNWSIEYVLLGGDIEFVPHRNLHFIFGGGEVYDIPADLYYAGLDGTWNEDGDEYWGEIGEDDLYAEVNVGRAPASTITDIIAFVNKTIAYETRSAGIDYYDDALFIGENLDSYPTWGGDYKDSVEPFFPPEFNITKLYERDETFGRTQIINEINAGKHFINNKGHGAVTYAGGLTTGDVMSLTNDEYFIWYSQCCDAGAFDSTWAECIAERVVANPDGGAVAFIGNSREGWYTQGSVAGPSIAFDKEFFNVLFNENIENIGRTLQRSKENSGVIGMMRWTYYTLNLIGDPTLKVGGYFASPPQDLTADAGDSFVSLTWDPPKEETAILNYNIYRGTSSGGEVLLATIGDILWFNDTSVTNGQTYYYYVTAVNAEREGLPSNEVNATPGIPTVPLDLQATPGDTVVHLTWNPPMDDGGLGITNYNIYRGTMSGGEVYLTMIGNVLNYDDGAVANGQTYYYKVAAVNAFTEGGMSNEAYATPGIPSAPLNLSTNAGDCYVNVTWLPPVQDGGLPITSYSIYRGLNSGEAIYHDTIGNQLYYHDTSVELDISYFYQVSAVNSFTEGPLSEEVFGKPSAAIWPMFLRDIEHSSTSPYDTSDNDLTLRWSFRGPRGSSPSPAIGVDGTIYFTLDEFFYAISPGGKLQWNQTLGDIITASPAIAGDGTIYVGCSDNLLYAFNPDGTIKWTFNAKKTVRTPTIGRDGTIYFGADNDKIFAVNPDGTEKWFYRLKGTIRDSVAIGKDGTIYCGVLNDKFMAFDPNGNLKWEYDAGYPFYNSPCISTDGTIYITSGVNLIAFDQNGTVKWTHTMDTVIISSSPIAGPDGTIYVSGSGKNYAVNPDGTRKWTYNGGGVYSPSMAIGSDGTIYTGGGTNEFLALNPDGSLKHSYGLSSYISVVSAPAIGKDGALYFITTNGWTNEGELYALGSSSYNAPVKNTDTGEQFDEIQAAIDDKDTVDGHTITVEAGTYYENLEMNKALTIIGEDRDNTIINGSSDTPPLPWPFTMGNVVNITSNLANITGFTITGGSYGIFILESHNISISENNISDNKYSGIWSIVSDNITIDSNIILNNGEEGIYIWTSKNNKITNNQVSQSAQNGIHIFDSNYNLFSDNIISFNDENGLLIEGCYNNILKDNIISKNANGMFLRNSDDNTITNNFIENNDGYGILLYSSDNSNANNNTCQSNGRGIGSARSDNNIIVNNKIIGGGGAGIQISWTNYTIVSNNTIQSSFGGFDLYEAHHTMVSDNVISTTYRGFQLNCSTYNTVINNRMTNNYKRGVLIWSSENNTISGNLIDANRGYGFFVHISNNNLIYHNSIDNNLIQAYDNGLNSWDNGYPSGGNYWSDYAGIDINSGQNQDIPGHDGLGDSPYTNFNNSIGAIDNYPLMTEWGKLDFLILVNTGWNFISTPLLPENSSVPSVFTDLDGDTSWTQLLYYDPSDHSNHWRAWASLKPPNLNDLNYIDNKMGVWLYIPDGSLGDGVLRVSGTMPSATSINLKAGWNMVGYPSFTERSISEALAGTGYDRVEGFNITAPYLTSELSGSDMMRPGEAYWVHMPADMLWIVDW